MCRRRAREGVWSCLSWWVNVLVFIGCESVGHLWCMQEFRISGFAGCVVPRVRRGC